MTLSLTAFKDYFTKLRTQAEGDKLPDVFWMNGPNAKLYATNNKLAALDDLKDVDWSKYPRAWPISTRLSPSTTASPRTTTPLPCGLTRSCLPQRSGTT